MKKKEVERVLPRHIYNVGDLVTNQQGHLRVILAIHPQDTLTERYEFMELQSLAGGSYFINWPKGKKSTQDIWNFERFHYLYNPKQMPPNISDYNYIS